MRILCSVCLRISKRINLFKKKHCCPHSKARTFYLQLDHPTDNIGPLWSLMLINTFYHSISNRNPTGNLVTTLGPYTRSSNHWGLNRQNSDSNATRWDYSLLLHTPVLSKRLKLLETNSILTFLTCRITELHVRQKGILW